MRPYLALLAVVVAAVALGCSVQTTTQGRGTRDEVVAWYLDALRRQDAGAMASLVGPGIDARADIHAVMQADGGLTLDGITASYVDDFGGIYVIVTVAGKASDGSTKELEVPIAREDGLLVDDHPVVLDGLRTALGCYDDVSIVGEASTLPVRAS